MKSLHLHNLTNRTICNLLLLFCSVPYAFASILLGYHLSFIQKEVEVARVVSGMPTAIIEQQSIPLWILFSLIIFLWGFIILKILCECIYRAIS